MAHGTCSGPPHDHRLGILVLHATVALKPICPPLIEQCVVLNIEHMSNAQVQVTYYICNKPFRGQNQNIHIVYAPTSASSLFEVFALPTCPNKSPTAFLCASSIAGVSGTTPATPIWCEHMRPKNAKRAPKASHHQCWKINRCLAERQRKRRECYEIPL